MNFKPDEKNIRSLLKSGCQFQIPRFQRDYSWEKKHYKEMFKYIMSTNDDGEEVRIIQSSSNYPFF